MRRGIVGAAAAMLCLAGCAGATSTDKAHADAVRQAEASGRGLEAQMPYDLAPLTTEFAQRGLVPGGEVLSASGTNADATVQARFVGVGWSESIEPTRTDLPVCFELSRRGGERAFTVVELQSCPTSSAG